MNKKYILILFGLAVALPALLTPPKHVSARPEFQQTINSPTQLINAVNALRLSNGLSTLAVNSILMQTAQSQADYNASIGMFTHTRPDGVPYKQLLLILGFPLAGDLSLGGFAAENGMFLSSPLVWDGVPSYWQDLDHMNTMLSPNFTHIGAGVSQGANGYAYFIDCAASTTDGNPQDNTGAILTSVPGSAWQGVSQYIIPVMVSTALPNGDVRHKVQNGQALWSLAIEYHTTINNIQALNNLGDNPVIFQGQELLIKKAATQPVLPTDEATALVPATPTFDPTPTPALLSSTAVSATSTPTETQPASNAGSSKLLVGILIVAAFVGAGAAVWLIRDPN